MFLNIPKVDKANLINQNKKTSVEVYYFLYSKILYRINKTSEI